MPGTAPPAATRLPAPRPGEAHRRLLLLVKRAAARAAAAQGTPLPAAADMGLSLPVIAARTELPVEIDVPLPAEAGPRRYR